MTGGRLYLKDATFVDWRDLDVHRGCLQVEVGPGGGVSFASTVPPGAEVIDCAGRLVTRAFAVAHHHIYSALARGMPPPERAPANFREILELIWWNLDKALDDAMVRASALATAVEAARCGCTFIVDHHASPRAAAGSLHRIAEALDEVGIGHLLCYELSDRDGADCTAAALQETEAYLAARPGLVGLHASFTVSDALLEQAVDLARRHDTGLHLHVAEAPADEEHCRATYGTSVAARLHAAGVLDRPRTLLAHCLHLDDAERAIVHDSAAWVVQNTESNQNNAVGAFDPRGLGDRILLGTDGMHSDMLAATRATYLAGQATGGLSPRGAYRRLRRVHDYLAQAGVPGDDDNDLVVLAYAAPTPVTADNFAGHLVYGLASRHVHAVIRQGRLLVDGGALLGVDADRILADARQQAKRLWRRL